MTQKSVPEEVKYIKSLLRDAGITEYDPEVINRLLSITYNHVSSILDDAVQFSQHANKENIDLSDVSLAIKYKNEAKPLSRNELIDIAKEKNLTPLPDIESQNGVALRPEKYCLDATNYQLVRKKKEVVASNEMNTEPSSTTLVRNYMFPSAQPTIPNRPIPRFVIKMANQPTPYLKRKTPN